MSYSYSWNWRGEELIFLPEKAIWREDGKILMIADLHLGKAETLQATGIPIPSDGDNSTLNLLLDVCHVWKPNLVIILGDLIHSRSGITQLLRDKLKRLQELTNSKLMLIGGNHDRGSWIEGFKKYKPQKIGKLWLSHEPEKQQLERNEALLNICGHLHPGTILSSKTDHLRLPCFAYDPTTLRLIIPAFGKLTGTFSCGANYQKWLVTDEAVIQCKNNKRFNK